MVYNLLHIKIVDLFCYIKNFKTNMIVLIVCVYLTKKLKIFTQCPSIIF